MRGPHSGRSEVRSPETKNADGRPPAWVMLEQRSVSALTRQLQGPLLPLLLEHPALIDQLQPADFERCT